MIVRPATSGEIDVALDLLDEAARWTAAIGQPNWPTPFPRRRVERDAEAGNLHLAEGDGQVVGMLVLQWNDRFWNDAGDDEQAGYVHRLVVRRATAGVGLGARLLAWADAEVRAAGRTHLRLDVVSHNGPLRAYYESSGFAYVRDVTGEWIDRDGAQQTWCTSLYERPID